MLSSLGLVAQEAVDPGQVYFDRGNFELAVQSWDEALSNTSPEENPKLYIDTSVRLAAAYKKLGRLKEAHKVLKDALSHVANIDDSEQRVVRHANVLMQLSDVYLAMRDFQKNRMDCGMKEISRNIIPFLEDETLTPKGMINEALYYLEGSEKAVNKIDPERKKYPLLWANILNRHGNVLSVQAGILNEQDNLDYAQNKYYSEVLPKYKDSLQFVNQTNDYVLSAKISINIIQGAVQVGLTKKVKREDEQKIKTILQQVRKLPDSHDKAFALLNIAKLIQTLYSSSTEEMPRFLGLGRGKSVIEKRVDCHLIDKFKIFDDKKHNQWFAYCTLTDALKVAENQGDKLAIIYAKFYLAQLYGETRNYAPALQLIRQALFHARNYPQFHVELQRELWDYHGLLFSLEWHLGKFLKAQSDEKNKKTVNDAYKRADKHLKHVRRAYGSLSPSFLADAKQFYFDWADFLLQQASKISDSSEKQKQLKEAIKVVEWFEAAEVRNYFQDDCITRRLEEKIQHLDDTLPSNVAIFYPLLFDDRIELLLVSKNSGIKQKTYFHKRNIKEIRKTIKKFRSDLSTSPRCGGTEKTTIYQWFEPIFRKLDKQINTLIIVPHGELYTIPFAALYDEEGKQFIIEKYALMVTPGIKLTDPTPPPQRNNIHALLNGLSVSAGGLPTLCNVPREISNISLLLGGKQEIRTNDFFIKCLNDKNKKGLKCEDDAREKILLQQCFKEVKIDCVSRDDCISKKDNNIVILQDEKFTLPNVKEMLNESEKFPYSIIHFATHGNFSSDPNNTYLQAFDGRISMDSLKKLIFLNRAFHHQPIDLLTLSACKTAKGDKRAALGLASVAIKADVPSALATLWYIDDFSTVQLMTDFYNYSFVPSKNKKLSKAKALQQAQVNLLKGGQDCEGKDRKKYGDPYYWAPFLLIGNGLKPQ